MNNPAVKISLRYALFLMAFQVVFGFLSMSLVRNAMPVLAVIFGLLTMVAIVTFIVMAHVRFEKENGPMKFGQALGMGMIIITIYSIVSLILSFAMQKIFAVENEFEQYMSSERILIQNVLSGFLVSCFILLIILMIEAQWKIFTKAGKEGWACIVPFYNIIVLLEIVKKPTGWFVWLIIPFINIIFGIWVVNLLSKAFGKDEGFTLGLIFLPFIFYPILGFGEARYRGRVDPFDYPGVIDSPTSTGKP